MILIWVLKSNLLLLVHIIMYEEMVLASLAYLKDRKYKRFSKFKSTLPFLQGHGSLLFLSKAVVWSYTCCVMSRLYKTNRAFLLPPHTHAEPGILVWLLLLLWIIIIINYYYCYCLCYYYFTIAIFSDSDVQRPLCHYYSSWPVNRFWKVVSIWKLFAVIWEMHWWCQPCT